MEVEIESHPVRCIPDSFPRFIALWQETMPSWYPQPRTPSTPDAPFTLQLEPQFSAKIQTLLQQEEEAGRSGSRDRRDAVGHRVDVQVRVWIHHPLWFPLDLSFTCKACHAWVVSLA